MQDISKFFAAAVFVFLVFNKAAGQDAATLNSLKALCVLTQPYLKADFTATIKEIDARILALANTLGTTVTTITPGAAGTIVPGGTQQTATVSQPTTNAGSVGTRASQQATTSTSGTTGTTTAAGTTGTVVSGGTQQATTESQLTTTTGSVGTSGSPQTTTSISGTTGTTKTAGTTGTAVSSGQQTVPVSVNPLAADEMFLNLPSGFMPEIGMAAAITIGIKSEKLEAWCVAGDGSLWRYNDNEKTAPLAWVKQKTSLAFKAISASSDGILVAVGKDRLVYKYDWTKKIWDIMPVNVTAPKIDSISVGNKNNIWAVNETENIVYQYSLQGWVACSQKNSVIAVAAGVDGTVIILNPAGNVYKYENGKWTALPGAQLQTIAVGDKDNIWGIGINNQLWQYVNGKWTEIKGVDNKPTSGFDDVAINAKGVVYCLDTAGLMYHKGAAGADRLEAIKKGIIKLPALKDRVKKKTGQRQFTKGAVGTIPLVPIKAKMVATVGSVVAKPVSQSILAQALDTKAKGTAGASDIKPTVKAPVVASKPVVSKPAATIATAVQKAPVTKAATAPKVGDRAALAQKLLQSLQAKKTKK